jgi:hypothetical protein
MTPDSQTSEYRKFALLIGIVLGLLGTFFLWRGNAAYVWCYAFSLLFFFLGFIVPEKIGFLYDLWMYLAECLGWLMTRVVLSALFFCIITPIGFFARLFGKIFLDITFKKNAGSYWLSKPDHTSDKNRFKMQY